MFFRHNEVNSPQNHAKIRHDIHQILSNMADTPATPENLKKEVLNVDVFICSSKYRNMKNRYFLVNKKKDSTSFMIMESSRIIQILHIQFLFVGSLRTSFSSADQSASPNTAGCKKESEPQSKLICVACLRCIFRLIDYRLWFRFRFRLLNFRCSISCLVNGISDYIHNFRGPFLEFVSEVFICRFYRLIAVVRWHFSIRNIFILLQNLTVFINPDYGIQILRCLIGCLVDGISCYLNNFRSPAAELVAVLWS